jgi:uncharacterized phage protein (TIGR02218 family)
VKSVSTALAQHLSGPVTTLATCWRITRKDGVEFFFTDHDRDIVFDGDTYRASSGYSRTAIANDASLGVDNLEVEGVFDNVAIAEEDLRAGLFDGAEVRIFLVNWADPAQGSLRMRRGWFGEAVLTEQGFFRTELRGMTQALQQRIGELYSPECRADLGDPRCKVPVAPPEIQRATAYNVGDIIRVRTSTAFATIGIPFINPGFDRADLTGWTVVSGSASAKTASAPLGPKTGTHFLEGGAVASFEVHQTVDLAGVADPAKTDAGDYRITIQAWRANGGGDTVDQGRLRLQLLDSSGAVLATPLDTGSEVAPTSWALREAVDAAVPAGTRQIRVLFTGTRMGGTACNAALDGVSGFLTDTASMVATSAVYEDRIYACVTAGTTAAVQPGYDTMVGNQTADGTAVLGAMEAWTRAGTVADVVDRVLFDAAIGEPRAVDGWFAGGVLTWETGPNAGRSVEVKTWAQATGEIELYLPVGYAIRVGDAFRIHPGCDKRLDTCINRFANVLNFRGEPYVPGQDAMMSYPDAR